MGTCYGKRTGKPAVLPLMQISKKEEEFADLQLMVDEEGQFMNRKLKGYFNIALAGNAPTTFEINMKFINLGDTGALHLAKLLPYFTGLRSLRLWKIKLGVEGAKVLGAVLPKLSQLEVLSLEDNEMKAEGTCYIAQALTSLQSLKELYLHVNKMGIEGILALNKPLGTKTNLQVLTLDENQMGKAGLMVLLTTLTKTWSSLKLLGLAFNQLGDEGAQELLARLPSMSKLKKLTLSGNNVTPSMEHRLAEAAPTVDFLF